MKQVCNFSKMFLGASCTQGSSLDYDWWTPVHYGHGMVFFVFKGKLLELRSSGDTVVSLKSLLHLLI